MARVFLRCLLLALVELCALVALCVFLWRGSVAAVMLTMLGAAFAGALLGPTPAERAELAEFLRQQQGRD